MFLTIEVLSLAWLDCYTSLTIGAMKTSTAGLPDSHATNYDTHRVLLNLNLSEPCRMPGCPAGIV